MRDNSCLCSRLTFPHLGVPTGRGDGDVELQPSKEFVTRDEWRKLVRLQRSQRCTLCHRFADFLHTVEESARFEHQSSFLKLEASAAQGCDVCRHVRQVLLLRTEGDAYQKLIQSTSTIRIEVLYYKRSGIGNPELRFECGEEKEIDFIHLDTRSWTPPFHEEFYPAEPYREIENDIENDFVIAKAWLEECCREHPACMRSKGSFLPKRMIDVGDPGSMTEPALKLLLTEDLPRGLEDISYCALSYCWGSNKATARLGRKNLDQFRSCIPWKVLPKTIQDAVITTRSPGVRYLWVDTLCIIQPTQRDYTDWQEQSAQMGPVYRYSICTISATGAADAVQGCFQERHWKQYPLGTCVLDPSEEVLTVREQALLENPHWPDDALVSLAGDTPYLLHPTWPDDRYIPTSPVNRRGWTFQEQYLSPRILHWMRDGVAWQCDTMTNSVDQFGKSHREPRPRHNRLSSTPALILQNFDMPGNMLSMNTLVGI